MVITYLCKMADDFKAFIKKTGIIDMAAVYNFVKDFFEGKGFKINEDKYIHKKGRYKGHNIEHQWEAKNNFDKYARALFKIKMRLEDAYDVEVEVDGKKQVMTKTYAKVEIVGNVEKDYKNRFESPTFKKLKKFYDEVLIKKKLEEYKQYLKDVGREFYDKMKDTLEVEVAKNG